MTYNPLATSAQIDRRLLVATLANLVWINASEVFRYFIFVMPMMREAFSSIWMWLQ